MNVRALRPVSWLCFLAIASAVIAAGENTRRLPRGDPESQGVSSSAVLGFVEAAEQKIDALHSFMLVRNGRVVAEGWWKPYAADTPHMMFSLSKSFASTAIGLAAAEGRLSIDDPVLKFFPEDAPATPSVNLQAMRVRDLLMMSTGHHGETIGGFPYDSNESLARKFLALPVAHKPGTHFVYNTPASYMLSAIVQKVSGQTALDYLRPKLFEPLGIENPTWDADKRGVSYGGFGLNVRTEDIAKFGLLYLQKGNWQGKQLLPETWIAAATARQTSNGSSPDSDWEQGYGFQFWRCRHGFYRGDGAHGQFCIVLPQYNAVIAITSGTRDMGAVMNLLWEKIVPGLHPNALPAARGAQRALAKKLESLTLSAPAAGASSPAAARDFVGVRYVFPKPEPAPFAVVGPSLPQPIESLALRAPDAASPAGGTTLEIRIGGQNHRITFLPGQWSNGLPAGERGLVSMAGAWTDDSTFTLKLAYPRTPFTADYRMKFSREALTVELEQPLNSPATRVKQLTAKAE